MSIVLFIIILAVLIFVHEMGHFFAAKSVGARVDEFGIGYPPRVWAFRPKGSETEYSINWIPFGGFVRILGEDGGDELSPEDRARSLSSKNRLAQGFVLASGVACNILFAWLLLAVVFMGGVATSVTEDTEGLVGEPAITILQVIEDGAAADAGLMSGDVILSFERDGITESPESVEDVQSFIGASADMPLTLTYERDDTIGTAVVTPTLNNDGAGVIGIGLDTVGIVELPFFSALIEAAKTSGRLLVAITEGLGAFVKNAVMGQADYSEVAGPVGIVGMVQDISKQGFTALLSFTAIISLNLAVINLVPFPALDGGRILFVSIEAITRRRLPTKVTQWANLIGFSLLILLMVAITVNDVIQLFS